MTKIYIVVSVDPCGYDSWDVSYHKTRKGALRFIMKSKYQDWARFGYIAPGSYDDNHMYINERELAE